MKLLLLLFCYCCCSPVPLLPLTLSCCLTTIHTSLLHEPRQVEFYFSDSNIPRDEFLLEQVKKHPEGCECDAQAVGVAVVRAAHTSSSTDQWLAVHTAAGQKQLKGLQLRMHAPCGVISSNDEAAASDTDRDTNVVACDVAHHSVALSSSSFILLCCCRYPTHTTHTTNTHTQMLTCRWCVPSPACAMC